MVVSLKANRKRLIAFLLLVVIIVGACVVLKGKGSEQQEVRGATNEERVTFLQSFGWEVDPSVTEEREVMIPTEFNEVYTTYNIMQKAQGFDLKPYAGMVCTQYKYKLSNYPDARDVYAVLLVYGEEIIGGDISCAEVDGFMHGFAADSAAFGESTGAKEGSSSSEVSENSSLDPVSEPEASSVLTSEVVSEPSPKEPVETTDTDVAAEDVYPTD